MTIVEDRASDVVDTPLAPVNRRRMPIASWRLAARLARREVRRRPGRTLLVGLLVAVPILAMTIGSILVRSDTDEASFARRFGTADLAVTQYSFIDEGGTRRDPVDLATVADGLVPEGTASTDILRVSTSITAPGLEPVFVVATRFDPTSPITDGIFEVAEGRLPVAADEVLLHPSVADDLGVGVGDRLVLDRPDRTVTVTGVGRARSDFEEPVVIFGELDPSELRDRTITTLVDLPAGVDPGQFLDSIMAVDATSLADLQNANIELPTRRWYGDVSDQQAQTLAWGWVIGVLALAALGVIIAAAFATSARRQLATVGQLAANGASPRLIRRTLSLQGTWSGSVGSIVGIAAGVGLFLLGTPLVERIAGRSWTNTTIRPLDLLVLFLTGTAAATLAALLPSRSLANTSVLQALAGRRPIRPVRARTVSIGVLSFVAGLFLLTVAAAAGQASQGGDNDLFALVAVLGGVGVLAGMCLASPVAITVSTAVASRLSASWKLSGRSLSRTRWRSAAVVTAIGVAGAFAVAAGTVATGLDDGATDEPTDMPLDQATLRTQYGTAVADISSLDPQVLREVRSVLDPAAESVISGIDLQQPSDAEYSAAFDAAATRDDANFITAADITIADEALLDGMGISAADRANLDEVGALALPWYFPTGDVDPAATPDARLRLIGPGTEVTFDAAPIQDHESRNGVGGVVMTEALADELGLDVIPVGIRFNTDGDLTSTQRRQLDEIRFGTPIVDSWIVGDESTAFEDLRDDRGFWIDYQYVNLTPSMALIQAAIAGAALLLVLLVVAIGLSLAAAESREERNTLIAVGASPTTLRRRSATTATLLAATGGLIAVPTGLVPVAVVQRTLDNPLEVPWLSVLAVAVVIPVLVGMTALAGSAALQRIRPPRVLQDRAD